MARSQNAITMARASSAMLSTVCLACSLAFSSRDWPSSSTTAIEADWSTKMMTVLSDRSAVRNIGLPSAIAPAIRISNCSSRSKLLRRRWNGELT